ncbi:MAG: hypothetical protein AAI946_00705 [Candidatus Hodgkinia cicadicola]
MISLFVYAVPSGLKLAASCSALTLVGGYNRMPLTETKLVLFAKRARLVLCSSCACYAIAKLINAVKGALYGHIRWLRLNGIGYKALAKLNKLELNLGFSHKLMLELPNNVEAAVFKTNKLKLKSVSLDAVTTAASALRAKRRADVYRAKGIILRIARAT